MRRPTRDWIQRWAAAYPTWYDDDVLTATPSVTEFGKAKWLQIADWKFNQMAHRRATARKGITAVADEVLRGLCRAALTIPDDEMSLRTIALPRGVGPALGSSILAALDPDRFTVFDERSVNSVNALLGQTLMHRTYAAYPTYLDWCRGAAESADVSLRELDRALFSAGRTVGTKDWFTGPASGGRGNTEE